MSRRHRNRATLTLATLSLAVLSLTACLTPPDDPPREHPAAAAGLGLSAQPAPAVADRWWRAYGDAQFDRLVEQALASNPTLAEAIARLRGAQAATASLRSDLLPHVGLDGQEVRQRFSANDVYPPPFAGNVYWQGSIKTDLSWNLDFWGRQADLIAAAGDRARAAGLDLASARLALIGALAQAYLDLSHAHAVSDLASQTEAQRQGILEITSQRVASGLDTQVERRQADGAVAEARVAREAAENDKARAIHQLVALTGAGAAAYGQIVRPTLKAEAVLPLPTALPADLLARRPDLVAARQRIEAALSGRSAAAAAFYPDINLMAFTGFSAIGLANLALGSSLIAGAGPAIHLPLFDAGALAAAYRGATADLDAAVAVYNQKVQQALQETADRLSEITALGHEREHEQRQLDDAEAAFGLAEARYRAGLAGYLSVLNAETQLLTARRQHIDIVTAQVMARIRLLLAVGGSFDPALTEPAS
jgi:NodT family efflux transporter outer membrane factor (OMF) lipoprotein